MSPLSLNPVGEENLSENHERVVPIRCELIDCIKGIRLPLLCLGAIIGALLVRVPQNEWLWALALFWLLAAALYHRLMLLMALVITLVLFHGLAQRPTPLADGLAKQNVTLEGRIVSLERLDGRARLNLAVTRCEAAAELPGCHRLKHVRLDWYNPPAVSAGDQWRLTARLKPPHGFLNPGRFDYGAWLIEKGFGATGYVRDAHEAVRLQPGAGPALTQRWLKTRVNDDFTRRWLQALTLGDGGALEASQWKLLRETGTTHLAVISGLHVGLVSGWVLLLGRLVARLVQPYCWRMVLWPWGMAGAAAVLYAGLSGFAPPAVRAAIMTLIALWSACGRHSPGVWQAWWLALLVVVVSAPLSLVRPGLWLSFGAVAVLIIAWRWQEKRVWWYTLLRSQGLLSLATGGATLLVFGQMASLSMLTNLIAIPWVSMVMVPLALLGWLLSPVPGVGQLLWWLFGQAAHLFETVLEQVRQWQPDWQPAADQIWPFAIMLLLICLIWLLPGLARFWRWLASIMAVSLFLGANQASMLRDGELSLVIHDVGQGQLIDIRTAHGRWLYDSGPRSRSGFMAITTLWDQPQHFDGVIVSHGDSDHAGGVSVLKGLHKVDRWWAPLSETIDVDALTPCRAGLSWRADAVNFTFLWPRSTATLPAAENDHSCVLLIETPRHRFLITGDGGQNVESRIVAHYRKPVDVLVAGHHGSHGSSSQRLVDMLKPARVIYSAGYLNGYGHPADSVVRRFHHVGSCQWNTAEDGAITVTSRATGLRVVSPRPAGGVEPCRPGVESGR
ncbi:DNA internalization-related competence protein ComEC/Rec2 [Kushneria konosiri]|uniref:DNA internalization-related competence protein ComEC/Rec2 n=1 Tax=Kushneria konosiri TaxID=698828 RepID=A0A2Z2HA95_9GAMM|nr:DNA internalization-related competence protein ComEC/Rec2 [Kushneria konosiri]ARS53826.1 DNA internalization-related competence protein ComEC/Rec2 [Kushneria konosiri]